MRVTITIDDDDSVWPVPGNQPPYVRGPYVRGPSLFIPREDGSQAEIRIEDLEATVQKAKEEG